VSESRQDADHYEYREPRRSRENDSTTIVRMTSVKMSTSGLPGLTANLVVVDVDGDASPGLIEAHTARRITGEVVDGPGIGHQEAEAREFDRLEAEQGLGAVDDCAAGDAVVVIGCDEVAVLWQRAETCGFAAATRAQQQRGAEAADRHETELDPPSQPRVAARCRRSKLAGSRRPAALDQWMSLSDALEPGRGLERLACSLRVRDMP
jgi:hypothetical protein